MGKVLAFINQKGGVGKTTSAVNVGLSLAVSEIKTLLIDLDPQANATTGLSELIKESSHIEPRKRAYIQSLGSVEDQLDMIYHDFDGWKVKVKEIKDMHPKYK